MAIQVETKDARPSPTPSSTSWPNRMGGAFGIGWPVSKAKEDWVLVTQARIDGSCTGFIVLAPSSASAARPACCIGMLQRAAHGQARHGAAGLMGEAYHRALMAFPDEDVVVGSRFVAPDGLDAFKELDDVMPRPGHRAVGEERAWGRRLAKRFGVEATLRRAERSSSSPTGQSGFLDHESLKPEKIDRRRRGPVRGASTPAGGSLVVYGWTMAEDLVKLGSRG